MRKPKKKPAIILVNPQMGENIGATARAMLNFSLEELRLVNPRDPWPNEKAMAMSSGALEKMPEVQVFDTLEEAVADMHYVLATTARNRDLFKEIHLPEQAAQTLCKKQAQGAHTAYIFGAERAGLTNEELSYCHGLITIPTNPDFSSLNLAQSVLLIAHEWSKTEAAIQEGTQLAEDRRATQSDMNNLLNRLEEELEQRSFFRSQELKPGVKNTIRNLFLRADMYEQETRTMHGVISALIGKKGGK